MKKLDVTNLVKIAGWIAVAVGGLMASWASDKQQQEQTASHSKPHWQGAAPDPAHCRQPAGQAAQHAHRQHCPVHHPLTNGPVGDQQRAG